MEQRGPGWIRVATFSIGFLVLLVALPAAAQVKIRFQTWHWNETPWVKSLEEFQQTFNAANPGIQVVRDDSRYADKEAVFITQSAVVLREELADEYARRLQH